MNQLNRDKLIYFIFGVVIALITLKSMIAVSLIIAGLVIFGFYILLRNVSDKELGSRYKKSSFSRKLEKIYHHSPPITNNDRLMREISLLAGSATTATRLVLSYRQKYPQKNERWCKEKIIYDLKRDRGIT
jgi:hypothetical protein